MQIFSVLVLLRSCLLMSMTRGSCLLYVLRSLVLRVDQCSTLCSMISSRECSVWYAIFFMRYPLFNLFMLRQGSIMSFVTCMLPLRCLWRLLTVTMTVCSFFVANPLILLFLISRPISQRSEYWYYEVFQRCGASGVFRGISQGISNFATLSIFFCFRPHRLTRGRNCT